MLKARKLKKRVQSYVKFIFESLIQDVLSDLEEHKSLKYVFVVSSSLISPHLPLDDQLIEWGKPKADRDWALIESRIQEADRYTDEIIKRIKQQEDIDEIIRECESTQVTQTAAIAQDQATLEEVLTKMCSQEQEILSQVGDSELRKRGFELSFYDYLIGDILILHCAIL
jgi:hypothetical protein